jgi:hypothetical protein
MAGSDPLFSVANWTELAAIAAVVGAALTGALWIFRERGRQQRMTREGELVLPEDPVTREGLVRTLLARIKALEDEVARVRETQAKDAERRDQQHLHHEGRIDQIERDMASRADIRALQESLNTQFINIAAEIKASRAETIREMERLLQYSTKERG